jgi:tetratricopeptide (TPR) repeat protein
MPALDVRLFHAESTMMRHPALLLTLFLAMFIPEPRTFAQTDPLRPRAKLGTDPFQPKANVGKARATSLRHNALGEALLKQKSYDQAIVEFEAAMKADPDFAAPYDNRGQVREIKRDYDLAIADFNEAIRLLPQDATAYLHRGWTRIRKRDTTGAISDLNEVLRLRPNEVMGFTYRGYAWAEKGNPTRAIADYDEAIRLAPEYVWPYILRGIISKSAHDYSRAIADFTEAIRIDSSPSKDFMTRAYASRGLCWNELREFDKAIADLDQAIKIEPASGPIYAFRGLAWRSRRQFERAIEDYEKAIALEADEPLGYNNYAWLLATCEDPRFRDGKKAIVIASRACELSKWTEPNFIDTLAAAHAEAGDFNKAISYQEKANAEFGHDEMFKRGQRRLELYRQQKAYREE